MYIKICRQKPFEAKQKKLLKLLKKLGRYDYDTTVALVNTGTKFLQDNIESGMIIVPDGAQRDGARWDGARWDGARWDGARRNGARWDGAQRDGVKRLAARSAAQKSKSESESDDFDEYTELIAALGSYSTEETTV